MKKDITYVGLDVHKESISVALAEEGRTAEVTYYGTITGDTASIDKLIKKLAKPGRELHFVYEAGPCGYDIYRQLSKKGYSCCVVAPSKTPRKNGERIKNDRRDAQTLARLHRAGELTAVYVPKEHDEAMRDLVRAREDAVRAKRVARQVLNGFILRHGLRYAGKSHWTQQHMRWLSDIAMPHRAQQLTLQEYINTVNETTQRVKRITEQIQECLPDWQLEPVVKALKALRGVSEIVAVTIVSELGDLGRFDNPRQIMAYLGLVPSEHSSGASTKRGGITKTGNSHVRRALTEAAHTYGHPARVSRKLLDRQEGISPEICSIAWKAQVRLCGRFRKLQARRKNRNKVVTAIARELCGFVWAIARAVPVAQSA